MLTKSGSWEIHILLHPSELEKMSLSDVCTEAVVITICLVLL